jgi:hypothetical protein
MNHSNSLCYESQPSGTKELASGRLVGRMDETIPELPGDSVTCNRILWADKMETQAPVVNLKSKPQQGHFKITENQVD